MKSFKQDSSSLKLRKNKDSANAKVLSDKDLADTELTNEDVNLIPYNNFSNNRAEETLLMYKLTKEEHKQL